MTRYIFHYILALLLIPGGFACTQHNFDDPEFDYNLKSAKVIETNNDFGLELFKKVVEAEGNSNVMISPASVSIALGMAYNGAETATRDAFEEVLNYEGLTREEVNEITRELIHVLVTNETGNLLEIANSMWYDDGFPVVQRGGGGSGQILIAGRQGELVVDAGHPVELVHTRIAQPAHPEIALGNVLGSNISNTFLILGVSAIIFPLSVSKGTVWKEIPS